MLYGWGTKFEDNADEVALFAIMSFCILSLSLSFCILEVALGRHCHSAQERGLIGNWKVTRPRDLIFCGGGFASTTIHDLCRRLPETENGKFLIKGGPEPGIFPHVMTNVPWQQPMTMM